MKRVFRSDAARSSRSVRMPLLLCLYAILVLAIVPPLLEPRLQAWFGMPAPGEESPSSDESWPAAPPQYVRPVAGEAGALREIPTATPLPLPVWRELGYLVSVEFKTASVVTVARKTTLPLVGDVTTDRLLLKAVGNVQIGIDLNQISDVKVAGPTIQLTLPRPQVASVELLPNESQIFDRQSVLFLSQYEGLETEALESARQQLRTDVASNVTMMGLAQEHARLQLTRFLEQSGFADVYIGFTDEVVVPY